MSRRIIEIIHIKRRDVKGYYYRREVQITTYITRTVITNRMFLGIFPLKDKIIYKIRQICPWAHSSILEEPDPIIKNTMKEEYELAKLYLLDVHKVKL